MEFLIPLNEINKKLQQQIPDNLQIRKCRFISWLDLPFFH